MPHYIILSGFIYACECVCEQEGAKEKVFCIPLTYISFLFLLLLHSPANAGPAII